MAKLQREGEVQSNESRPVGSQQVTKDTMTQYVTAVDPIATASKGSSLPSAPPSVKPLKPASACDSIANAAVCSTDIPSMPKSVNRSDIVSEISSILARNNQKMTEFANSSGASSDSELSNSDETELDSDQDTDSDVLNLSECGLFGSAKFPKCGAKFIRAN